MNPRAILPWILCAALLLGVGVWWSGGDRGAEGVHLPLAAGDADDTGSQASPFTLHSAGSARSTAESDSRHEEPGDQPGADEDPAVETSPAGYLLVPVVQHPGQAPMAGAELTWMELEPDLLRRAYERRPAALLARRPERHPSPRSADQPAACEPAAGHRIRRSRAGRGWMWSPT